jgi:hypothetical protein
MAMSSATTTAEDSNILAGFVKNKEDRELVAWVDTQYKKMKSARQPYENQWRLNYAFYKGRQNLRMMTRDQNVSGGRLVDPVVPPYRVRSIRNKIKPIIRTEMSKLTSNKPNASVVPASNEDKDLYAALAGEKVWEAIYANHQLHKIFTRAAFWLTICGTAFIKDWWDPQCVDYSGKYQGDVRFGSVTAFHLLVPDLFEEDLEDQEFLINVYTKPVDWVKRYYDITVVPDVQAANEILGDSMFKASSAGRDAQPDSCLVKEVWFKPGVHKQFPQGGMVTIICGQVAEIFTSGMPFGHTEFPFTKLQHIPTGEFYTDSVITDLIEPQRDYNKTSSQIIESKNRMAIPQLMAPRGIVQASKITTAPGQLIEYTPGLGKPEPLPMQPLPNYVLQELERAMMDMQDISAQHEVSHGGAPPGVTAATAISYLQERDDSAMATTYSSVEQAWEKIARHTLSNVVKFWDEPRLVNTTGTDGFFDAIALKGSEVAGGTDIRMEAGSALPVSKAARQAFLMDMMDKGYIAPDKGLSMMDMGGLEKLYDEIKADERAAGRENMRMAALPVEEINQHMKMITVMQEIAGQIQAQQAPMMEQSAVQQQLPGLPEDIQDPNNAMNALQGLDQMSQGMGMGDMGPQPVPMDLGFGQDETTGAPLLPSESIVPVNTWDNHQVHIDVHNRYRKGQAFELLPPEAKEQFEAHVKLHADALNQAAMAAGMMMPPGTDVGVTGAENGSGTSLGNNQFGPPGTEGGGSQPPPM